MPIYLLAVSVDYDGEIIIRIPIIPLFNANSEEIKKIAEFLNGIKYKAVELLPYHAMSRHKYEALNIPFTGYPLPNKDDIESYKRIIK